MYMIIWLRWFLHMNGKDSVVFPQIRFSAYDFRNEDHEYWTPLGKVMRGELWGNAAGFFLTIMQECSTLYHILVILEWV